MGTLVNFRFTPDPAEVDLVEACRRGDKRALAAVFTAHSPYIEGLLGRMVGASLEIEDLLQSTFVAAIGAFPNFRGEAQVRTWLARIAVRIAQERLRSAAHRRRRDVPDLDAHVNPDSRPTQAEGDLDTQRRLTRLYHHLDAIGAKKRVAFMLHVFEGHPMEEVAALTGGSVAATKSRVFWARRELWKRASRDPVLRSLIEEWKP